MKYLIILSIVISSNIFANIEYFHPIKDQDIRDITFEVRSKSIGELIYKKLILEEKKDLVVKFYWSVNHKLEGELISEIKFKNEKLKNEVLKILEQKVNSLLFKTNVDKLKNYKEVKKAEEKTEYIDQTGLEEFERLIISSKGNEIVFEQKANHSSSITNYYLNKVDWCKKKVLKSIKKTDQDNTQNIVTKTEIKYGQIGTFWFPTKLNTLINQTLNMTRGSQKTLNRIVEEDLNIENLSINKNEALKWFAKQK